MKKTPLERWIGARLGTEDPATLPERIEQHQLQKLQETVSYVRENSPFYRQLFSSVGSDPARDLESFARLPFTTANDLRGQATRMLCTSQDEIERVVTLQSSGTTGPAKRVFFTAQDLEKTVDFFAHGMATLVDPGEKVIIFLPGGLQDSVGDLLARALLRTKVQPVVFGPVRDFEAARAKILKHPDSCLVGIPTQILALARGDVGKSIPKGWVKNILLSTDYVSDAIRHELAGLWGCRVLAHYGMTETGLGGGVECEAGEGYHLREADLYTEIVDPATGLAVPDGTEGEVVFTTLTRRGMPLVRYRTGDLARFITSPCPCGSVLRRLGPVQGRLGGQISLKEGHRLRMSALDEALFPIPGVLDFSAKVAGQGGKDELHICFQTLAGEEERVARNALSALLHSAGTGRLFREKLLTLGSITFSPAGWPTTGVGKRRIHDKRRGRRRKLLSLPFEDVLPVVEPHQPAPPVLSMT